MPQALSKKASDTRVRRMIYIIVRIFQQKPWVEDPNLVDVRGTMSISIGVSEMDPVPFKATAQLGVGGYYTVENFAPTRPVSGSGASTLLRLYSGALAEALNTGRALKVSPDIYKVAMRFAGESLMEKVAMEFPTQEALDTYLKKHPGADKSKHKVSQPNSGGSGSSPEKSDEGHALYKGLSSKSSPEDVGKAEKWVTDTLPDAKKLLQKAKKVKNLTDDQRDNLNRAVHLLSRVDPDLEPGSWSAASVNLYNMVSALSTAHSILKPKKKGSMEKTAHGPVAIQNPDTMLYMIDPGANKSKFYEMAVVRTGRETDSKREEMHGIVNTWTLMRRWGRLTDTGATGRVDSINDGFDSEQEARSAMNTIRMEKTRKGYQDVSRSREYPIGLGAAGFGWGGQAACRVIPELGELREAVSGALGAMKASHRWLAPVARQDSSMARKLAGMISEVESGLENIDVYLAEQLAHCR